MIAIPSILGIPSIPSILIILCTYVSYSGGIQLDNNIMY